MRAVTLTLITLLAITTLGCTTGQTAPPQGEATRQAERIVNATVEAAVRATIEASKEEPETDSTPISSATPGLDNQTPLAIQRPPATAPPEETRPNYYPMLTLMPTPMPTPTATPPPTPTAVPTPTPSPTPTLRPVVTRIPTPWPTATPRPTATPVQSLTAKDVIPRLAYERYPSLTEYILGLPWTSGNLTAFEINTIELLIRNGEFENAIEHAVNEQMLDAPDPFAMDLIGELRSFESVLEVTDPRQIKMERRVTNLPLRGQTNLTILRAKPGSKVAMDLLEHSVRAAERFMDVPFPTDQVTLRFTKRNVPNGYAGSFMAGTFSGGQVNILPRYDQDARMTTNYSSGNEKRLAEIIAHEVAHYYWHHHIDWIDEGMAETLTAYIENERTGTPISLYDRHSSAYQSIIDLEIDGPGTNQAWKHLCNYTMGQSLFLDIRDTTGNQEFVQSARRLYKTRNSPFIESVKSAFPKSGEVTRVINQHYYGDPDPNSIKESTHLTTVKQTSVSLQLGRKQTLPPWDRTPLRSFSASKYYGPIWLHMAVSYPGPGREAYVTLTVEHTSSAWSEQRIILAATSPGGALTSRHEIGPRRTPWTPGNYVASIERYGRKLAEISWTVTP